ncbi:MAG: hypothetical protein UZ01_02523 [Candidatus Brocadia sinica]|nr:MAG: hypothetical protein UZ01_02523 [Candidatus Brocadia sinica]MCK6468625.1 hypothetical protein [Candidatus Brocadia sinica]NUO06914.1 hypothetical protein [Candidatus Brocadia sinica]
MAEQGIRFFSLKEVLGILNIPKHRLDYLFDSRRLKSEDFLKLGNGHRVFKEGDIVKIKQALFDVQTKG